MKKKTFIIDIICILFIILFIYAATSKLFDYDNFKAQLGRSPLLARFWNWIWVVPTIEIIIAGLLPFPTTKLFGLYASFSLMTMFTAYIFAILRFSEFIPCSCGGVLSRMSWTVHLWFNVTCILLALTGIILQSNRKASA
ncbi:MAG TPA: MauE/DoxX family redox-associated membrane protein [Puia sp.]|jgi:hypothetical protein|nr:MauE/DoxX family redox-associated membrane protein [Puia sp.]